MASSDTTEPKWPSWLLPAIIAGVIAALIAILLAYCGGPADDIHASGGLPNLTLTPPATTDAAATPAPDLTEEFLVFVMFDREREPVWLDQITRVFWAENGQLHAETSYPADWTDKPGTGLPVQSICEQLAAYEIRRVQRWTGVAVLAADGTELFIRTDQGGSCRGGGA